MATPSLDFYGAIAADFAKPNATVKELIDEDTKWWKISLLENLFSNEQVIMSMPVSVSSQEDKRIWRGPGTNNGVLSVKSAYYIQKKVEALGVAESSSKKGSCTVWRNIWGLSIPNVEKKFLMARLS